MSFTRFHYQTLVPTTKGTYSAGPSPREAAVGAGVKLLHKTMVALNGWAVSWRANLELRKMAPDIERAMLGYEEGVRQTRPDTGALVVIGIQEWAQPDPTGTRAQSFLTAYLAGAGREPRQVLRRYLSTPSISASAPKGWRRRDAFVWVTRTRG